MVHDVTGTMIELTKAQECRMIGNLMGSDGVGDENRLAGAGVRKTTHKRYGNV